MQGKNIQSPKISNYDSFQLGWKKFALAMFGNKARSMSGFTKDLLGYPTREWLGGD
jgi:hypothetical protein